MKKIRKKILAAISAASLLMTIPGTSAMAETLQDMPFANAEDSEVNESGIVSDATSDTSTLLPSGVTPLNEEAVSVTETGEEGESEAEQTAQAGNNSGSRELSEGRFYKVGDKVWALLGDTEEGRTLLFYSKGGTLDHDWKDEIGSTALWDVEIICFSSESEKMYFPTDSAYLFAGEQCTIRYFDKVHTILLDRADTSKVKDMGDMFHGCTNLRNLDLSSFNTSNVMDMSWMFYHCQSLTNLDLCNFDISNVVDMHYMFSGCENLTDLNLSSFNTSNVSYMHDMFSSCNSIQTLKTPHSENCSCWLPVLPVTMYDASGKEYTNLPKSSLILTRSKPTSDKISLSDNCILKLTKTKYVCTGKAKKPAVEVYFGSTLLENGKDYKITCENNIDVGTARVKVTGTGRYEGTLSQNYRIVPRGTRIKRIVAKVNGFALSWKKENASSDGYQIQYSLNKNFKNAVTKKVSSGTRTKLTLSGLKGGKTYYVRIRTYRKLEKTYYSYWSSVKSIKTK